MATRGRKPAPEAAKKAAGTSRPDRVRDNTVEFPVVRDPEAAPSYVKAGHAADLWAKLEPMMRNQRALTTGDLEALAHHCNLHGKLVRLWLLDETPPVTLLREFRTSCAEFGLTPASRQRVPRSEEKPRNAFQKNGRRGAVG